uniref:Rab-GAP TBC domain-containing protein n=1 Tax=Macrostomum lignano TaxID=282301 RepID=A0A1I8J8W6_9PLAT
QPRRLLRRLESAGCCLEPPPLSPTSALKDAAVAPGASAGEEADATYRLSAAEDAADVDADEAESRHGQSDAICAARTFQAWLAQARHSRTLRRRLAALVGAGSVGLSAPAKPLAAGLLAPAAGPERRLEACRTVYWSGCPRHLRFKAWPLLLGVQAWEATEAERCSKEADLQARLENCLSEWSPLDAIVRERAKEAAIAPDQLTGRLRNSCVGAGLESNLHSTDTSNQQASNSESSSRISTSRESLLSPASPASNGGVY